MNKTIDIIALILIIILTAIVIYSIVEIAIIYGIFAFFKKYKNLIFIFLDFYPIPLKEFQHLLS
jgi:hypothetical protein